MVGRHVLVQPRRAVEAEIQIQRDLQEVDRGPVELADHRQRLRLSDTDLAVEPGRMVGARITVGVGEKLNSNQLSVIAEPDPGLGDPRSRAAQLG